MNKESSLLFCEKYFNSKERIVKIELENGEMLEGALIGFFYNSSYTLIIKWRFLPKHLINNNTPLLSAFHEGIIIQQSAINNIIFATGEKWNFG